MAGESKYRFFVQAKINGLVIPHEAMDSFEWKSFVNGGYEVRITVTDVGHRLLNDINLWNDKYLRGVRQDPLILEFKIGYTGGPKFETYDGKFKKAIISDLTIQGDPMVGDIEFVAIDPPSWYLNAGKSDGKVFVGNVSKVIEDVVSQSTGGAITAKVSKTRDDKNGRWGMHRQDPKTFIMSLLDWSSSVLNNYGSSWIIGVDDDVIYIQDQKDSLQRKKHLADYNGSTGISAKNDIMEYNVLNNTLLTAYQTRLVTQGISAVSGKFLDKQTSRYNTEIRDENTTNKLNAKVDKTMSYAKPQGEYSTSIVATPELSGGELGLKYEEWIGGRPQQLYISMLPMVMRCRFTVRGDYRLFENKNLGVATIKISWKDIGSGADNSPKDYFLHGHWIVYGFHHRMMFGGDSHWWTDVYAYRIDYNSKARNIPESAR